MVTIRLIGGPLDGQTHSLECLVLHFSAIMVAVHNPGWLPAHGSIKAVPIAEVMNVYRRDGSDPDGTERYAFFRITSTERDQAGRVRKWQTVDRDGKVIETPDEDLKAIGMELWSRPLGDGSRSH